MWKLSRKSETTPGDAHCLPAAAPFRRSALGFLSAALLSLAAQLDTPSQVYQIPRRMSCARRRLSTEEEDASSAAGREGKRRATPQPPPSIDISHQRHLFLGTHAEFCQMLLPLKLPAQLLLSLHGRPRGGKNHPRPCVSVTNLGCAAAASLHSPTSPSLQGAASGLVVARPTPHGTRQRRGSEGAIALAAEGDGRRRASASSSIRSSSQQRLPRRSSLPVSPLVGCSSGAMPSSATRRALSSGGVQAGEDCSSACSCWASAASSPSACWEMQGLPEGESADLQHGDVLLVLLKPHGLLLRVWERQAEEEEQRQAAARGLTREQRRAALYSSVMASLSCYPTSIHWQSPAPAPLLLICRLACGRADCVFQPRVCAASAAPPLRFAVRLARRRRGLGEFVDDGKQKKGLGAAASSDAGLVSGNAGERRPAAASASDPLLRLHGDRRAVELLPEPQPQAATRRRS